MAEAATAAKDDDFDALFDEAIKNAGTTTPDPVPQEAADEAGAEDDAAKKAADEAAAKAAADEVAKANEGKTPEEIAAAKKAEEDAAAKAAVDEAAAKANEGKTPEQIAADEAAAKKAADEAAAKAAADEAAAKAAAATPAAKPDPAPPAETAEEKAEREKREAEHKAALADYEFTPDEQKALESFKKDFPTEHVAIEAMLKRMDRVITQRVYNGVNAVLQRVHQDFTPVVQGYTQDAEARHFATIKAAHADYDAMLPKVSEWVAKQPKYLQAAMKDVLEQGSAQEVIDLFDRFKKDAGVAPVTPAAPAAPAKPATPPPDDSALTPVSAKRAAPAPSGGGPAKDDFDGAFDDATKKK